MKKSQESAEGKRGRTKGKASKLLGADQSTDEQALITMYGHSSKKPEWTVVSRVHAFRLAANLTEDMRERNSAWSDKAAREYEEPEPPESVYHAKLRDLKLQLGEDLFEAISTGDFSRIDRLKEPALARAHGVKDKTNKVRMFLILSKEQGRLPDPLMWPDLRELITKGVGYLPPDKTIADMAEQLGLPRPISAKKGRKPQSSESL
jgi:hypothetical protein